MTLLTTLPLLGLPYSKFSKGVDKRALEEGFIAACGEQQHVVAFQAALSEPFVKELLTNPAPSAGSIVNRVAMMAHLLVHEKALPLWEKLHQTTANADRPAVLDQTDGVAGNRLDIAERLHSLVEVIKEDLDLSFFLPEHCGAEAADAMKDVHASQAVFRNASEILDLYTSYCNQHDILLQRLDASGNFEQGFERRVKCFASFVGPPGKSKNMGLYYCFLLWENQPTRLTSHRLGSSIGRSSSSSSFLPPDSQGSGSQSSTFTLSKGDQRRVAMFHSIMNPSGRASPPFGSPPLHSDSFSLGSADGISPEESASRKRLLDAKAVEADENTLLIRQKAVESVGSCISNKVARLASMMNDPQFTFLSAEQQTHIRNQWYEESQK